MVGLLRTRWFLLFGHGDQWFRGWLYLLSRLVEVGLFDFGCGDERHLHVVARPTQSNLPHLHSVLPSVLVHVAPDGPLGDFSADSALARGTSESAMTSERAVEAIKVRRMVEFLLLGLTFDLTTVRRSDANAGSNPRSRATVGIYSCRETKFSELPRTSGKRHPDSIQSGCLFWTSARRSRRSAGPGRRRPMA